MEVNKMKDSKTSYWIALEGTKSPITVWKNKAGASDDFVITIFVRKKNDILTAPIIIRGTTSPKKRSIDIKINGESACGYDVILKD